MELPFADLEDAVKRFEACSISKFEWTHHAHLAVGLWHVHTYGPAEALERLRTGIRRLNDSHGTPNTETSGYHETITRAYVQLLAQFLENGTAAVPLSERVRQLMHDALVDRNVLLRFYSVDRLMSSAARAAWVEPDIRALALEALVR